MTEGPHTHWIDGRIVDDEPRISGSPWVWLAAVVLLVIAVDLTLGLGRNDAPTVAGDRVEAVDVRAQLRAAATAAEQGRPAFVLVGDSVLAGDVMAASVPDWRSQRVIDHMHAELGPDSDAALRQVAFDGLLPVDALRVLAELDRVDPDGEVRFVLELNLRYFSRHYAKQRECTRAELCELGVSRAAAGTLTQARAGLRASALVARDWLRSRAPIRRHWSRLDRLDLSTLDGLTVARGGDSSPSPTRAEGLARVQAHYRDSTLASEHAQVEALIEIVERLRVRDRKAAMFFTPLDDGFVDATLPGNGVGRRQELIAALIHERTTTTVELLDLDHPLFGSEYFLDHVHLDPEGNRLLAINLLHELGLPLRERPFAWMMIHDEDHDRSLVHRRGQGYADGSAWRALFRAPEGVAVSRSGEWIVIADTENHALRQLRGSMQIVERLAGVPRRPGHVDGRALDARLEGPSSPEIIDDTVYFLDGHGSRVRELADGVVATLSWSGPRCADYRELEARVVDSRGSLLLLCADSRVLAVDLADRAATLVFNPRRERRIVGVRGLEPTDDGRLLLADRDSRIWSLQLDDRDRAPELLFDNSATELLPRSPAIYPFSFDEMRVNRIIGMEWVERYGALLIQDQHDLGRHHDRLLREQTERIHLRLLDLDAGLIWPWIKAIPHAEAFHMWNETSQSLVSYYHRGAMAIVQDDASLVYLERSRSRVIRIADGMLAAAKTGNLHTVLAKIELAQPLASSSSATISATLRPDRYLDVRHEPIPRAGPYVALWIGSSLSAVSDRLGNYSLARLLELELQAELGYRDNLRLDLYQRTLGAPGVDTLEQFLTDAGPPPDVVLFEIDGRTRMDRLDLDRLEQLAARHDTLVIVLDNSALASDRRDGLRASSDAVAQLSEQLRERGLVLLQPSDPLLRELLVESPWGNQPWGLGLRHGAPWAIELTAKACASLAYPAIREHLRGRTPAREREGLR